MNRKELLNALTVVKPGVANKDLVEAMTYFFFTGTHVVSYNDVISIQFPIKTDFSSFVNANDLYKLLSKITSEDVQFTLNDSKLMLKASKVKSTFATITDDKILKRLDSINESVSSAKFLKLPNDFVEAVNLCSFVASKNESDQALTCVSINLTDVISSDNMRIARTSLEKKMKPMLLKASEIKSLLAINPAAYALTDSWIHFKSKEGCIFSIRRVKGNYPDFGKHIDFDGTDVTLSTSIVEGIELATIFVDSDDDKKIVVSLKKGQVRIFKENESGSNEFREEMDYDGPDISFSINPDFLKEMLSHSTTIKVGTDRAKLTSGNFTMVTALYGD